MVAKEMTVFTIPGQPYAKKRPRSNFKTGSVYDPAENASFERTVGIFANQAIKKPLTGPIRLTIWATFQPARSWSKKKTAEHMGKPHTQKPDLDNLEKAIMDGLNRIAWIDDCQVAEVSKRKVWGPEPHTVVFVEPMGADLLESLKA